MDSKRLRRNTLFPISTMVDADLGVFNTDFVDSSIELALISLVASWYKCLTGPKLQAPGAMVRATSLCLHPLS